MTINFEFENLIVEKFCCHLSGPLNRLNAILSLLHPLDRYRALSAIGSAIGRPYLALSRFHAQLGVLNRPVLNRLGGSTARWWRYSVSNPFKTSAKQKRDRGRDSQPRPRPRLNSQPQGATKVVISRAPTIPPPPECCHVVVAACVESLSDLALCGVACTHRSVRFKAAALFVPGTSASTCHRLWESQWQPQNGNRRIVQKKCENGRPKKVRSLGRHACRTNLPPKHV